MFTFSNKKIDFSHKLGVSSFPEDDFNKHIHYFYEIIYFVKGNVDYTVETETRTLNEGDLVLIHPGKVHFATVNEDELYERYVLKFPDYILPPFLKDKLEKLCSFFKKTKKFYYLFDRLDDYVSSYNKEEIYVLFVCDLIKLCILLTNEVNKNKKIDNVVIQDIIQYIDNNLDKNITLNLLSEVFHYSTSYISSKFIKYMRVPIIQYIKSKKIFLAHQLILNGEKKNVVAKKVGFDDYSTFYRSYLKVMGFSPNNKNND